MTSTNLPSPFYAFQILSDLQAIARHAAPETLGAIAELIPTGATAADLARTIAEDGCRLTAETVDRLHPLLLLAATLPRQNHDAFVVATAMLLADRLQEGAGRDSLYHHWDTQRDSLDEAPRPVAAALRRGFALCHRRGLVRLDPPPGGEALYSAPQSEVIDTLLTLARTMTPEMTAEVSQSDYGRDSGRHQLALAAMLAHPEGQMHDPGNRWFPGQVLERSSLIPGTAGFVPCTALILIEAITYRDPLALASTRWGIVGARYFDLPPAERDPILSGFRHLAEGLPGWSPYPDRNEIRVARDGVALPFPTT